MKILRALFALVTLILLWHAGLIAAQVLYAHAPDRLLLLSVAAGIFILAYRIAGEVAITESKDS